VLNWLAAVLGLGALGVVLRWAVHPYDSLGRRISFPTVLAVALVVPALVSATPGVLRWREERRLESAASTLAGARVQVECQTFGQAFLDASSDLGWVAWGPDGAPEHKTLIKHEPCADLRDYLGSNKAAPTLDQVIAVHVLTHEAMHMRGEKNEAVAECEAVQRDAQTAGLLGADPFEAVALAQRYWREVYPHMTDPYVSSDCHAGGSLDEGLPDPPWAG
jgi:hypothetical protein